MPTQTKIPDNMLAPGDILEVTYDVVSDNDTLVGLAIHSIKSSLAADARFNYQGSRWDEGFDADQVPYRRLIISVQVRKSLREERTPTQLAGIGVAGMVLIGSLLAILAGAVVNSGYGKIIEQKKYTIIRDITNDPNLSEAERVAALNAVNVAGQGTGTLANLTAAGGSLVTAGIIVAVLWALSLSRRPSGAE